MALLVCRLIGIVWESKQQIELIHKNSNIFELQQAARLAELQEWFSGKIQRCHRWAPGSIPGSCSCSSERWYSGRTSAFQAEDTGSIPVRFIFWFLDELLLVDV